MTTNKDTMPELKPKEGFEYMIVSFPDKGLTIDGAIDIESGNKVIDVVLKAECDREYTRATQAPDSDKIVIDRGDVPEGLVEALANYNPDDALLSCKRGLLCGQYHDIIVKAAALIAVQESGE